MRLRPQFAAAFIAIAIAVLSAPAVQGMQGTVYTTNADGITTICTECSNHHQPPTTYRDAFGGEQRVINPPALTISAPYVSTTRDSTHERAANIRPSPVTTYTTTTTTYYTDVLPASHRQRNGYDDDDRPAAAAATCSRCAEAAADGAATYYGTANNARVVSRQHDGFDDESNYYPPINGQLICAMAAVAGLLM